MKTPPPLDQVYDAAYFGSRMAWKPPVYKAMAEEVKNIYGSNGLIIELGSGNGEFLQHFHGYGLEGASTGVDMCRKKGLAVWQHDLRKPLADYRLDPTHLTVSIEVAEHIEPEYVDIYVATLKQFSNRIILTASPEPSKHHPNPQPREYWIEKMGDEYIENSEALRNAWKAVIPARYDYLYKNLMVFERKM